MKCKRKISKLGCNSVENIWSEEQKNKQNFGDLWDFIKHTKIGIISVPEDKEREKETKRVLEEIKAKNLLKLLEKINLYFQIA